MKTKITKEEINNLNKYFRLVNYLSVGQLYLLDNPLLKRPLDIKEHKTKCSRTLGDCTRTKLYIYSFTKSNKKI